MECGISNADVQSRMASSPKRDEAVSKLIWMAFRDITADWKRVSREWKSAMNRFAILYEDRITLAPR